MVDILTTIGYSYTTLIINEHFLLIGITLCTVFLFETNKMLTIFNATTFMINIYFKHNLFFNMNFLLFFVVPHCKLLNKIFFWKSGTKVFHSFYLASCLYFCSFYAQKKLYEKEKHALA